MAGTDMAASTRGLISDGPGPISVRCGGWNEEIFLFGRNLFCMEALDSDKTAIIANATYPSAPTNGPARTDQRNIFKICHEPIGERRFRYAGLEAKLGAARGNSSFRRFKGRVGWFELKPRSTAISPRASG